VTDCGLLADEHLADRHTPVWPAVRDIIVCLF